MVSRELPQTYEDLLDREWIYIAVLPNKNITGKLKKQLLQNFEQTDEFVFTRTGNTVPPWQHVLWGRGWKSGDQADRILQKCESIKGLRQFVLRMRIEEEMLQKEACPLHPARFSATPASRLAVLIFQKG